MKMEMKTEMNLFLRLIKIHYRLTINLIQNNYQQNVH